MLVGDAITACGLTIEQPDGDVIVVAINQQGKPRHWTATDIATKTLGRNVYQAGGIFRSGSIVNNTGRVAGNLVRIVWLAFDADLSDYLGWTKADLWGLDDETLGELIELQRADLERVFGELGLSFTRLDYTGYGLCGYLYLDELSGRKIADVQAAYKGIVGAVNQRWGNGDLVDRSVSDAGTRITRIPGSINDKGEHERTSRTLSRSGEVYSLEQLAAAAGQKRSNVVHLSGPGSKRLSDSTQAQVIEHVLPVWTHGQKHIVSLGLAGMLAKAGVAQEQTLQIVQELSTRAGDNRPDDRAKTVLTTYKRLEAGEQTAGYFSLKGRVPDELLGWLDQELGRVRQATVSVVMPGAPRPTEEDREAVFAAAAGPVPESVFYGWFRDYRDLMLPTCEAPAVFHLGAALALAGAMIGRRVHTSYVSNELFANLYTVLVGPTGTSRKDTAIKRALRLPDFQSNVTYVRPSFEVRRDVSSSEGIVAMLEDTPNVLLYITELSALKANAARKGTTTINDRLIEAWDTPHRLENLNKQSPRTAMNPYLSIVAATQPGRLARSMTDEDIHSGFANRWLYLLGDGSEPMDDPPGVDKTHAWDLYMQLFHIIERYPEGTALRRADDAAPVWKAWYHDFRSDRRWTDDERSMRVRLPDMVQKIALIYAVSDGAREISLCHLQPAIDLVEWSWRGVQAWLNDWGATEDARIAQRIRDILARRGPLHKRQLQQAIGRRLGPGIYMKTLDAMVRTGEVGIDPSGIAVLMEDTKS